MRYVDNKPTASEFVIAVLAAIGVVAFVVALVGICLVISSVLGLRL